MVGSLKCHPATIMDRISKQVHSKVFLGWIFTPFVQN